MLSQSPKQWNSAGGSSSGVLRCRHSDDDGRTWSNTRRFGGELEPDSEGRFLVSNARRSNEQLLEQAFFVEPFSDVVFGAGDVVQLFGFRNRWSRLWQDGNSGFFMRPHPTKQTRYFVHSDLYRREEKLRAIRSESVPPEMISTYLQLPVLEDRVFDLTLGLVHEDDSPIFKALRLEAFLRDQFEYTLDNPSGGTPDPLADFLFDSKAGHCEYFATSQAVMLRILGIPSRVVNGFRRGEYNEFGNYFIVRQSDAHSWVEAFFPGAGWIEFDPTPPLFRRGEPSLSERLGQLLDSLDVLWTEVVTFDRVKQAGFFQTVRAELDSLWNRATARAEAWIKMSLPDLASVRASLAAKRDGFLLALAFLLTGTLIYRYRRYIRIFLRRRVLKGSGKEIAQEYYLELLEVLDRKGFRKSSFETPSEFASRVRSELHSDSPVKVVETYYRNRFGGYEVGQEELAVVYACLRELRK